MRSLFGLGCLTIAGVLVTQACGSSDKSIKPRVQQPEGGAAGAGDGGAPDRTPTAGPGGAGGTAGTGGTAGMAGEGGVPTMVGAGGSDAMGGVGGATSEGGAGGASNGGASGEGGATGEGGVGGAPEGITCEVAPTCSQDLSNLGTGDFSVSFKITTTGQVSAGIVAQRQICMHSKFWDIRLRAAGTGISIETDDQVSYTSLVAPTNISDGLPHDVRICRKSGVIYAFTDGVLDVQGASLASFATLPAFASKTSVCTSFGTVTLDGTLENVCVGAL